MREPLYKEINSRLTSGDTFKIYYKKCYMTAFGVSSGNSENNIYRLFPSDVKLPERIYFVLVNTKSKNGDQTTNPFWFIRKYHLVKNNMTSKYQQSEQMLKRVQDIQQMFNRNQEVFNQLIQNLDKAETSPSSSKSGSDIRNVKRQRIEAQSSEDSKLAEETEIKLPVFIQSLELCVNSSPISQVHFYPFNLLTF